MTTLTLAQTYNVPIDNELCLEFANTLDWRVGGTMKENLNTYADLLLWSHERAILSDAERAYIEAEALRHPKVAESVLQRALSLREAIARIFAATSRQQTPGDEEIALINAELRPATQQLALSRAGERVALICACDMPTLDRMLLPIALSTAETLTGPTLDRVRQCADDEGNGCGFFFVDISRNRSRRWCSMESCGNRAKARRHYQRERSATSPPAPLHLERGEMQDAS